jgi:pimeloyl-ACP methyl ester carboxylesterase
MKSYRWPIGLTAAVVALIAASWGLYVYANSERLDLDAAARARMPGQFAKLSDGYTHYELGGPAEGNGGRVVVLAAGFSVPYYIWDPTFNALTAAGFRVLRYDYYGRGYSDRPAIPFNDAMYVRQLAELLDAAQIAGPVDLVGISFGGSFITSFADKYPDRVRSLIYFDPSIRMPYQLGFIETMPSVCNFLTVLMDESSWADGQLADFLHPEHFPEWAGRYRDAMQYKGFRRARLSEIVSNNNVDQTDQLKRVGENARPVLVIWGKQDNTVPFEESESFMKSLPQARLVAVEGSGHLPQWEQPDGASELNSPVLAQRHREGREKSRTDFPRQPVFVSLWLFPLYRLRIDFNSGNIRPAAGAVSATRHQVHKSDFIDLAKVWTGDPVTCRDEPLGIHFQPSQFGYGDIVLEPICG